jgi:arylsulfatase A-like enzyme
LLIRLPFRLTVRVAEPPLAAALLLAIANAVDIAVTLRMPPGGPSVRAVHHAFDAALTLGVGLVAALAIGTLGHALRRHPIATRLVYLGVGVALASQVLTQDLRHQAEYVLSGVAGSLLLALFVLLCGAALPVGHQLGLWFGQRRTLRWVALAIAMGGVVTSHLLVRDDYAALHASIEWTAATLAMGSLGPTLARSRTSTRSPRARRLAWTALALAGLAGLVVTPDNRTRVELFQAPGALGAWTMARTRWPMPEPDAHAPAASVPRLPEAPVPPSSPPLVDGAPVVVMITIDATRGDVVLDAPTAATLPFFTDLRRSAATFAHAISPGSQTSVSLTALFSGRTFSQLAWSRYGKGPSRFLYAAEDPAPRFPELLQAAGVKTALFGGTNFLSNEYGVARGFDTFKVPEGRRHAVATEVLDPLIARLNQIGPEPTFLYGHIMEPHAPYDRGKKKGTDFERYVSEVGVADAQIARVARVLSQRFPTRGLLIVSADHGEAFGEHGTFQHTKTLYEELLHVPLFIRGAQVKARRVETRVSLVDIGATILDVFGVPVPAGYLGESLVPMLRGRSQRLLRPLIAEGRLRRAYYTGDVKVIEDLRRKVVEAYDLRTDPLELTNLFDAEDPRALEALATLRAFFDAYELKKPGYTQPYKP